MSTKGEFVTYPVGQGLFYAGKLKKDNEEFNFIYDCGSLNKKRLVECITEYRTFNGTENIDMLVISHFDLDHINGLEELAEYFKIKRIFFPYLRDINIKLYSYLLKTLSSKKVLTEETRVNLITEDDNTKNPKNPNEQMPNLDKLESEVSEPAPEFQEDFGEDSKIFVLENTPFKVFDWLFDFYNYPLPENGIRSIRNSFNLFIKRNNIKNFNDFINCKNFWDSFNKSVYSDNIREYKFMKNNNNISLCMMHAPVRVLSCQEKSATLLTGDLNLEKNDIFIDFNKKYGYIKFKLKVFFLPHHGSRLNWNDKLVYYCKNTLSIATVASSSKYKHPDFEVISKTFLSKSDLVCITEQFDSYKYIVEQKAPVTALSTTPKIPNGGWYNTNVQVRLKATDLSGSGVARTEYSIDGGTWELYDRSTPPQLTNEGTNTIEYKSVDNDRNEELYKKRTIRLDKTNPVTELNTNPDSPNGINGWYTSDVQVNLSATDAGGSGVANTEYLKNDGKWIDYNEAFPINTDGTYKIDYRSTDIAGNIEEFNTKTINLDKTAPLLKIELDPTTIWPADQRMVPIAVKIDAIDATSGIDSVVLTSIKSNEPRPNDIQNANYDTPITGLTLTDSFELLADRADDGTGRVYTITYTATDKAGNVTTESVTVSVPLEASNK